MSQSDFEKEALLFGKYFLKKPPDEHSVALYLNALRILEFSLSHKEKKVLVFMLKNHWSVGFIDAGLVILNPKSHLRKKMFVMLAILEASPHYTSLFLPRDFSFFHSFYIAFTLAKSAVKTLVGIIFISIINGTTGK